MKARSVAARGLGGAWLLATLPAVVPLALVAGVLAAGGWAGPLVAAAPVTACWWLTLRNWRFGVWGMLAYLPWSGAVALALHPWRGGLLLKDLIFVGPAYVAFLASAVLGRQPLRGLPPLPLALIASLASLVVAQCFNGGVANWFMAAIGVKVWLFYLPLLALGFALITSDGELFSLFRFLVVLAVIPCAFGIAEVLLGQTLGYRRVMVAIYGGLAEEVTQGFTCFSVGGGSLCRIPSTFSFVSQYFAFTLAMLTPAYAIWRGDPLRRWRSFAGAVLVLVAAASFLSGSRSAFLFVPLLLFLVGALDSGVWGAIRGGPVGGTALAAALAVIGTGLVSMYVFVGDLFTGYASDTAYGGLVAALSRAPLGEGVGTNTGPARYALADPASFVAIENYYAKVLYELGIPGVIVVVALFAALMWYGYAAHRNVGRMPLRPFWAALLGFITVTILNSFKGWMIDIDPVNVYFWVFAGILLKLPHLAFAGHQPPRFARARPGAGPAWRRASGQVLVGRASTALHKVLQ